MWETGELNEHIIHGGWQKDLTGMSGIKIAQQMAKSLSKLKRIFNFPPLCQVLLYMMDQIAQRRRSNKKS